MILETKKPATFTGSGLQNKKQFNPLRYITCGLRGYRSPAKVPNLTFGRITSRLGKADASIVLLSLLCDFADRL